MSDDAGLDCALDTLAKCTRYARWLYAIARPHLGRRVVEAGAGLGTLSRLLAADDPSREVVLADTEPEKVTLLSSRFADSPKVSTQLWTLPDTFHRAGFVPDTFVLWNVLEHVEDDVRALTEMRRALAPGGRVVVISPAGRRLMSAMDFRMGHFRRYDRRELPAKARCAGLVPVLERRVNVGGAIGWLVNACFFERRDLPDGQSRAFDLLVPLLRLWEAYLPVPWGLSILFVAEKPSA